MKIKNNFTVFFKYILRTFTYRSKVDNLLAVLDRNQTQQGPDGPTILYLSLDENQNEVFSPFLAQVTNQPALALSLDVDKKGLLPLRGLLSAEVSGSRVRSLRRGRADQMDFPGSIGSQSLI